MADVVRLGDRLPRSPKGVPGAVMDAKILLFTGVRYERREESVPAAKSPARNGAKKR